MFLTLILKTVLIMSNIRSVMNHINYEKIFRKIYDSVTVSCEHPVTERMDERYEMCLRCATLIETRKDLENV